jgi:hypothetical protein
VKLQGYRHCVYHVRMIINAILAAKGIVRYNVGRDTGRLFIKTHQMEISLKNSFTKNFTDKNFNVPFVKGTTLFILIA